MKSLKYVFIVSTWRWTIQDMRFVLQHIGFYIGKVKKGRKFFNSPTLLWLFVWWVIMIKVLQSLLCDKIMMDMKDGLGYERYWIDLWEWKKCVKKKL